MKLFELRNIDIEQLKKDCAPWLLQNPHNKHHIYRGFGTINTETYRVLTTRQNRRPTDTPSPLQKLIDNVFRDLEFTALRSNSIFCTGSDVSASDYGISFIVMPIGDFSFTWSPNILDLWTHISPTSGDRLNVKVNNVENLIKKFNAKDWNDIILNTRNKIYAALDRTVAYDILMYLDKQISDKVKEIGTLNQNSFSEILKSIDTFGLDLWPIYRNEIRVYAMNEKAYKSNVKYDANTIIKLIYDNYQNTDLIKAIDSGNEIMLHCDKYYIFDQDYYNYEIQGQL